MKTKGLLFTLLSLGATLSLSVGTESKPAASDLVAPVQVFVRAFNGHQAEYPAGAFTEDTVVLDEFPTFVWQRHGAMKEWYAGDR